MKTKEIDVWVLKNKHKEFNEKHLLVAFSDKEKEEFIESGDDVYKAKLIIEIPEQKKQLTRSAIANAYKSVFDITNDKDTLFLDELLKELGFTNE